MDRKKLKNDVKIVGELHTKKILVKNVGTADEFLMLNLTIKTSDVEQHEVGTFSYKYTSVDGKRDVKNAVSKLWEGHNTVANEFKSIKDDGEGDIVEVKGALAVNRYVGKDGLLKEFTNVKATFCSRVKDLDIKLGAVFGCHMHILSKEEVTDVTGEYIKVKTMLVDGYSEEIHEFRVYREKSKKVFDKKYDEGDSGFLEGYIVNRPDTAMVVEEQEEDEWGEEMEMSATSSKTITRRYLEIVKGDIEPMDTDDEEHPLNEDKMKSYRKNIKAKQEKTMEKASIKAAKEVEVSEDDMPF